MNRAPQSRVLLQQQRLAELRACAVLTASERAELQRLDLADRKRAAVRKWYQSNPDNRQRMIETSRRWYVENPGCTGGDYSKARG